MGLMAELVKVVRSYPENRNGGPGVAHCVEAKGLGGVGLNAEIYQAPGLVSVPPKDTRGVFIPLGAGRRNGVVIAMHNFKVIVTTAAGGTVLYSTTQDGATVQARVELDNLGKIKVSNATQSLKAILDSLSTALTTFASACTASATDPTLVAAATALVSAVSAYRTQLALLLKD